ncbi:SWR1 complex subunit 6-like [Pyrus ussuriensis x Pyrus communis]|uniref:SWR1 complex subunit 6-like n=1 Tax=Pyrus ussuriensis x Pyrus communis TaxID=2448454 RepID=A0A5N5GM80_9ROSA|nr:SWR1 complex subunit 6-like [Pyrus ussuriensis x Pyrus communis]
MDDDGSNPLRRMSSRTRKVASKMTAALQSSDNRTQAALARLEALENDNAGLETVEVNDDDEASLDDDDGNFLMQLLFYLSVLVGFFIFLFVFEKKSSLRVPNVKPGRQKLLRPRRPQEHSLSFYMSSTSRRHFCTVCGSAATYTCVRCGVRFCSGRCQNIHNDTRCLKFVA